MNIQLLKVVILFINNKNEIIINEMSLGIAVIQLLEGIYNKISEMPDVEETGPQQHLPAPERLEWVIQPEIERRIELAIKTVDT